MGFDDALGWTIRMGRGERGVSVDLRFSAANCRLLVGNYSTKDELDQDCGEMIENKKMDGILLVKCLVYLVE